MSHIPIDKVLYRLTNDGARPSIDLAARIPGTSKVERTEAKSPRPVKPVVKGLARSTVVKLRISKTEVHIRVKGSRDYVGVVRKQNNSRSAYGFRGKNDLKETSGFSTQEAAIKALLERS